MWDCEEWHLILGIEVEAGWFTEDLALQRKGDDPFVVARCDDGEPFMQR